MHEIGLVDDILCVIKAKLKDEKPNSKVKKVNICIGELEYITTEHFEFHFRERTKGTPLEGTEIAFKKVEAKFKCKNCSYEFHAEVGLGGCPKCKSNINDVIAGKGISVESLETTHD